MGAISALGNEYFFLLLLPVLYWCFDRRRGAQLGLLLLFSILVNDVFKLALASPRPFWSPDILRWSEETSFGFPSGHAQNAAVIWTFLALRSQRPKFWLPLALALVLLISFSRIALGVHYPADTFGGALLGFAILAGALKAEPSLTAWWRRASAAQRIGAGAGVCALLAGIYVLLALRLQAPDGATEYAKVVADVRTWKNITLRSAAFLGLVTGLAVAIPLSAQGSAPQKVLRFVLGAIGIGVFYFGLKMVGPDILPLRFARYFLTTFWVSALAPALFAKLGLGSREKVKGAS